MSRAKIIPRNIGTARSPVSLGHGVWAYRRNGRWRYRDLETALRFGRRFIEASDAELMLELEKRGYRVLCPAHECVDRPNLPCPACEMDALRALGLFEDCG